MTTTPPSRPIDLLREACARHEAYLRGRLRGLGVPEAGLDDAVQDVFEVLVRRIGAYDRRFSLRQWMAGVARKIARRHRERALRAPGALEEAEMAAPGLDPESGHRGRRRWPICRRSWASSIRTAGRCSCCRRSRGCGGRRSRPSSGSI
ncbi:hypothetical protein OV079_52530 [Nannocystis pusilla]|uniref:RNA polymerase sigma-70 region 2 domain-containing protein n=1 Tax=Nannocystis pusilla TaxID=889268 RepID=A0A9X3F915_9BACT|nr:hypothetical protein [Nannocystis pusilla]MCY1014013.1 hypothetical protein [Nannocystis pusilla]